MIIAKLTEPIVRFYQTNTLTPITVSGSYLVASTQEYILGAPNSTFTYRVGNLEMDENGEAKFFKEFIRNQILLTSDELSNWGIDDTACLQAIATKLGIEVDEFLNLNIRLTI